MAITRTLDDTDSVQIIYNKWLEDVRQYQVNVDTLFKHGTINAALTNIGTSLPVTIVVTENTAVNATTDLTSYPNIHWLFLGDGRLSPASGVTLTLYCPGSILAAPDQICFGGEGTVKFYRSGTLRPEMFGGGQSVSDNLAAVTKMFNAMTTPTVGRFLFQGSTYSFSSTLLSPLLDTYIHGEGKLDTILSLTATGSGLCGFKTVTGGITVKDLTVKVASPPATNLSMTGIRCDLAGTSVTAGRQVLVENVKCTGFNIGLYADGDTSTTRIDDASYRNVDVQISGPASSYAGSAVHIHRCKKGAITGSILDMNTTGDHGASVSGLEVFDWNNNEVKNLRNASGSYALKCVGEASVDRTYYAWSIRNTKIKDTASGILVEIFRSDELKALTIDNVSLDNVQDTGHATNSSAIRVSAAGTASIIRSVNLSNLCLKDLVQQGMTFATASGCEISSVSIDGVYAYYWSSSSAGTFSLIGTVATSGTIRKMTVANVCGNGNSYGRSILAQNALFTNLKRLKWWNLTEQNVTQTGTPNAWPFTFVDLDATPSVAHGNAFIVANSGATSVTNFDDPVIGETYVFYFTNGNTTLVNGTNLITTTGANVTPSATHVLAFYCLDGIKMYQTRL